MQPDAAMPSEPLVRMGERFMDEQAGRRRNILRRITALPALHSVFITRAKKQAAESLPAARSITYIIPEPVLLTHNH